MSIECTMAFAELQLLDTEAESAFDRIISKLARVFEMPIGLISLVAAARRRRNAELAP